TFSFDIGCVRYRKIAHDKNTARLVCQIFQPWPLSLLRHSESLSIVSTSGVGQTIGSMAAGVSDRRRQIPVVSSRYMRVVPITRLADAFRFTDVVTVRALPAG